MLQLGALSKSENFTVITLWPGNTNRTIKIIKVAILVAKVTKVMTVTVINQTVSREMSIKGTLSKRSKVSSKILEHDTLLLEYNLFTKYRNEWKEHNFRR